MKKKMIFSQPSGADEAIVMMVESGCLDEDVEGQRYVGAYSSVWVGVMVMEGSEGGATLASTREVPRIASFQEVFTWAPAWLFRWVVQRLRVCPGSLGYS